MGDSRSRGAPSVRTILLALLVLGLGTFTVKALVRSMTYPVPPWPVGEPPAGLREVALDTALGDRVVVWAGETGEGPTLLFFHGNGENLATMAAGGTFESLADLGLRVAAVDYPGYGRSGGKPSEESLVAAAEALLDWAGEEGGDEVWVCGWSLGAAVAAQLAARHGDRLRGLILLSAWSSLADVAERFYPSWLVRAALSDRYDSLAAASLIDVPTLVLHGRVDQIIPVEQGEALAVALGDDARWVAIDGAGHNDLLGVARVWREMATFVRQLP